MPVAEHMAWKFRTKYNYLKSKSDIVQAITELNNSELKVWIRPVLRSTTGVGNTSTMNLVYFMPDGSYIAVKGTKSTRYVVSVGASLEDDYYIVKEGGLKSSADVRAGSAGTVEKLVALLDKTVKEGRCISEANSFGDSLSASSNYIDLTAECRIVYRDLRHRGSITPSNEYAQNPKYRYILFGRS